MKRYKSIYFEDAISGSEIVSNDKFCLLIKTSDTKEIVLYDKTRIIRDPEGIVNMCNDRAIYCYGEMETSPANPHECWSVVMSAAVNKFGPFLYDTMLSIAGEQGLIPDRGSVSEEARKIWEYYFTRRKDQFKLVKIDDYQNPETEDKNDDGWVHHIFKRYANRDLIDHIYYYNNYKSHLKIVKKLKENHTSFISQSKLNKKNFEISVVRAGNIFFSNNYNK